MLSRCKGLIWFPDEVPSVGAWNELPLGSENLERMGARAEQSRDAGACELSYCHTTQSGNPAAQAAAQAEVVEKGRKVQTDLQELLV